MKTKEKFGWQLAGLIAGIAVAGLAMLAIFGAASMATDETGEPSARQMAETVR